MRMFGGFPGDSDTLAPGCSALPDLERSDVGSDPQGGFRDVAEKTCPPRNTLKADKADTVSASRPFLFPLN
jgi:hypothetical protein